MENRFEIQGNSLIIHLPKESASCTVDGIRDGAESNFDCDCDFFPDRNRIVGRISVG